MSTSNTRISISQFSLFTLALCLFASVFTNAQSTNYTKSTVDSNTRGSLEVDPSTLGMSFNMPMGGYGGRGATLPISLTYSSKIWRIQHFQGFPAQAYYANLVKAKYAEKSVSGWTTSTGVPYIEYTGQEQSYDWDIGEPLCFDCVDYNYQGEPFYVGRLLLHLPDGSTHELRKNDTQGNATSVTYNGIFTAVDGSRIKYNADNSTIYLPDGSRYWLTAPNGVQYFDRNGNTLTYNTTSNQWTDTLGRVINAIPLSNSTVGYVDYLIPGVGGVNQKYTLRWQKLGETGVMTFSEPLRFTGNRKYGYQAVGISPSLFQSGDLTQRIVDTGIVGDEHNPTLLTEIILPNGLSYKFTYNVFGEIDKVVLPTGGYERFEHATVPSISDVDTPYSKANRGVIKHWVSATGNSADEVLTNYSSTGTVTAVTNISGSRAERTLIAASGNTHMALKILVLDEQLKNAPITLAIK